MLDFTSLCLLVSPAEEKAMHACGFPRTARSKNISARVCGSLWTVFRRELERGADSFSFALGVAN